MVSIKTNFKNFENYQKYTIFLSIQQYRAWPALSVSCVGCARYSTSIQQYIAWLAFGLGALTFPPFCLLGRLRELQCFYSAV